MDNWHSLERKLELPAIKGELLMTIMMPFNKAFIYSTTLKVLMIVNIIMWN